MQMINLKPTFDRVKYNALDYIGLYEAPVSDLGTTLAAIVEENGADIFLDTSALTRAMSENGIDGAETHRVCLMTHVTGFRNLLNEDERTAQNDLDRFIQNASRETGFNRETLLRLTGAIAFATGNTMNYEARLQNEKQLAPETVAVLAGAVCKNRLDAFGVKFDEAVKNPTSVTLNFENLEPLVNFGIPRAKYYLGYCLLYGIQQEQNEQWGLQLLQEAADDGDSEAAGALGDYHFEKGGSDHWTKAYDYYTGFGSLALDDYRRSAIVNILNHKVYNKKILAMSIALFLGLLATVIWVPGSALFAARLFWGWFALVLQLGLLVVTIMHYRSKPYDCVYRLPAAMVCVWFLYMLIRVLF